MIELADMFVHMIFPHKALGAFTSASIYGTICERRRMHNYMVPLQVGWASETTSAYITYSKLWSGRIHSELGRTTLEVLG
jgi:hypothetical protein